VLRRTKLAVHRPICLSGHTFVFSRPY